MTKVFEERKKKKQLTRAMILRDAAICLNSDMDEIIDSIESMTSSEMNKAIRLALNDFEKRTNTAVQEFEWPKTEHDLQLSRKEAEDGQI